MPQCSRNPAFKIYDAYKWIINIRVIDEPEGYDVKFLMLLNCGIIHFLH